MPIQLEITGPGKFRAELFTIKPPTLKGDEGSLIVIRESLADPELTEQARLHFECLECPLNKKDGLTSPEPIRIFPSKREAIEAITPVSICIPLLANFLDPYKNTKPPACQDKTITLQITT